MNRYAVVIETGPNNLSAFIPDAPGRAVTGRSREQVQQRAREALGLWLEDLREEGHAAPDPTPRDRLDGGEAGLDDEVVYLEPLPLNPVSLTLERAIRERGLSQLEVARRMGVPASVVSRLVNPFYWGHSAESMRRLAEALEAQLEVRVVPIVVKPEPTGHP